MTTEAQGNIQGNIIEVRRKKENNQSPSSASVIITSGYLLDDDGNRVEAIFKNPSTGAEMANLEIPSVMPLRFDLSKPIDAHNFAILQAKIKRYSIYKRVLDVVDLRKKSEQEVVSKERCLLIQAQIAKMKEIEVVELCRYLQFVMDNKTVSELKQELYGYTDANPDIVEAAIADETLPIKAIINDAMQKGLIIKNDTGAYMRESTKLIYGKTVDDVIKYFTDNPQAVEEIARYKPTTKEEVVVKLQNVAEYDAGEVFENAKRAGIIEKVGKQYTYLDVPLGGTKEDTVSFLKNNPNIAEQIKNLTK